MTFLRRIAVVISLVLCGLIAFAVTTVAFDMRSAQGVPIGAKGPGPGPFLTAGNYHNTSINASFSDFGATSQISVNVNSSNNAANPLVGPTTLFHEVDVTFQACDFSVPGGPCGGGCFIPDNASDFTYAADLSSASLTTTVGLTTATCQNNPVQGFTLPFTVNIVWAGSPSNSNSSDGRYACSHYTNETLTTGAIGINTSGTATTSLIPGTFGPLGSFLTSFDQRIHVQGAVVDSCPQLGGKGAGFGPQAAGTYQFVSRSASASFPPNDPTQASINLFVTSFTNTSQPAGGRATTQVETDLNISQFGFGNFISNCYVIPATAFNTGSQTTSLHAVIDANTPGCHGVQNSGLPPAFTVDAGWNSTSPLATFRITGTAGCAGLHIASQSTETTVNAHVSGSIPGVADVFQTDQSGFGTSNFTTHVTGTGSC